MPLFESSFVLLGSLNLEWIPMGVWQFIDNITSLRGSDGGISVTLNYVSYHDPPACAG